LNTWMPGTSPGMTTECVARSYGLFGSNRFSRPFQQSA
jgi:hypothetical protein